MNRSFLLGIIGTAIIALTMLFGPLLAPYDMNHFGLFKEVTKHDGTVVKSAAPFPPSKEYLLGTDTTGRDSLSIILRGARITVTFALAIALLRLLIGLPLAYLGTVMPRTIGWVNEKCNLVFTTIPGVMFVAILAGIFSTTDAVTVTQLFAFQLVLITLVGVFPTAFALQKKIESIGHMPFMEGQAAIGSGRWRLLRKHILPHLSSYTAVLFVAEIAQVLWLITQIGFLFIFIGGSVPQEGAPPTMRFPEEWAGNMAQQIRALRAHPMAVLWPVFAMSFAILSFNLLAEGIRKRNESKWGIN